jgi:hypothetical protein
MNVSEKNFQFKYISESQIYENKKEISTETGLQTLAQSKQRTRKTKKEIRPKN